MDRRYIFNFACLLTYLNSYPHLGSDVCDKSFRGKHAAGARYPGANVRSLQRRCRRCVHCCRRLRVMNLTSIIICRRNIRTFSGLCVNYQEMQRVYGVFAVNIMPNSVVFCKRSKSVNRSRTATQSINQLIKTAICIQRHYRCGCIAKCHIYLNFRKLRTSRHVMAYKIIF